MRARRNIPLLTTTPPVPRSYTISIAALQGKTVWNSTPEELGLTADQLQAEQQWLKDFNEGGDQLNWETWKDFQWKDDAFSTWSHIRLEGKSAMADYFGNHLKPFKKPCTHKVSRQSFDVKQGLIYQTLDITRAIDGDPDPTKTYTTPTLLIIHKKIGESKISGMEAYLDMSEIQETLKALSAKAV
ncbi:hypothetical protein FRC12_011684 [Ceratobasidium sp. 428]|nr:hypothetical protein FRC12_011684 [Ceratobasidium sp. 428]